MKPYTSISVIYNPNSTGDGRGLAEKFIRTLDGTPYAKMTELIPTAHAGHAEDLTYDLARATSQPLIISSSGDGGYHEVINGAMRAQSGGAKPTTGLLPAGNANDHYRNLHDKPMAEMILAGNSQKIDLLRVTTQSATEGWQRYAHSYAGVGLTPKVGDKLNQVKANLVNEKWITFKTLWQLKPVKLMVDGSKRSYDSLIFSNVSDMSKVIGLSEEAKIDDGKFEITSHLHDRRLKLLKQLFVAATSGLNGQDHASSFHFQTTHKTLIQLDGEVKSLPAQSKVKIDLARQALECIV